MLPRRFRDTYYRCTAGENDGLAQEGRSATPGSRFSHFVRARATQAALQVLGSRVEGNI